MDKTKFDKWNNLELCRALSILGTIMNFLLMFAITICKYDRLFATFSFIWFLVFWQIWEERDRYK